MKKFSTTIISFIAVASLMISVTDIASAAVTPSKDENKLKAEITMLDAHAQLPQADKVITRSFTENFNVGTDKISSLLTRNLQYGEIAAVLAFAEKMPGGITDANINRVVTMRQGKTGWDRIASSLKVNITDVVSKLGTIEEDSHKSIKTALAESMAAGRGAGGVDEHMEMPGEGTGGIDDSLDLPEEGTGGVDEDMSGEGTGGTTGEYPEEIPNSGAGGSVESGGY